MSWLVRPGAKDEARLRLLCLPFAGGGTNAYRPWRALLPPEVELCLAQLPGREVRFKERALDRLGPLVDGLAQAVAELPPLPLVVFGHSMGALVGFELVRRLEAEGKVSVVHLVASGRGGPTVRDRPPLHRLPEPEFREAIRRLGGTPDEVLAHEELMRLVVPVLRADLAVDETHQALPDAQVRCPVLALGGTADALVPTAGLEAWRTATAGAFRLVRVDGGHFFVLDQRPAVLRELGALVRAHLEPR